MTWRYCNMETCRVVAFEVYDDKDDCPGCGMEGGLMTDVERRYPQCGRDHCTDPLCQPGGEWSGLAEVKRDAEGNVIRDE